MVDLTIALIALASAITIGICSFAAALAEKTIAIRGIAAMAEKESLFGGVLILTVIPETIVIFGLVVSILIIGLA
ncbi:MAG: hypothetical protein KKF65_06890 [Nanoarchaeota archaeon]|nr:hypothetical protein [Nanoarchaeota archaeon]